MSFSIFPGFFFWFCVFWFCDFQDFQLRLEQVRKVLERGAEIEERRDFD